MFLRDSKEEKKERQTEPVVLRDWCGLRPDLQPSRHFQPHWIRGNFACVSQPRWRTRGWLLERNLCSSVMTRCYVAGTGLGSTSPDLTTVDSELDRDHGNLHWSGLGCWMSACWDPVQDGLCYRGLDVAREPGPSSSRVDTKLGVLLSSTKPPKLLEKRQTLFAHSTCRLKSKRTEVEV